MMKKKNKKQMTTYDRMMKDPKQKKLFDQEYQELVLSEMIIAAMKNDDISVRALAKEAGLSPTVIQAIRSGKKKNFTFQTFLKMFDALGYAFVLEKGKGSKAERIELSGNLFHAGT